MPLIWRYLLEQYLKVLCLCVLAFIAILLTTRLQEIARFASLGAPLSYILMFTIYQIPYVLPIVLPIAGLISATILIQRMSHCQELTALRACGISLRNILTPILLTAAILALANFYIVSEISTHSHLTTRLLKQELKSINPLILLQNKNLMYLKGVYTSTLGNAKLGESASDVIIITPNSKNDRLNLLVAKQLSTPSKNEGQGILIGKDISLITSLKKDDKEGFEPLVIENIHSAEMPIEDFSLMLKKESWRLNTDHLQFKLLLAQIIDQKDALAESKRANEPKNMIDHLKGQLNRSYSDIMRRFSLALAVFTFTLMGAAFGLSVSRTKSRKGLTVVITLTALYLAAFFVAKGVSHLLIPAMLLYLLPHAFIISLSGIVLYRISKGVA